MEPKCVNYKLLFTEKKLSRYVHFGKKFPIQTDQQQIFSANFLGNLIINKIISPPRFFKLGMPNFQERLLK